MNHHLILILAEVLDRTTLTGIAIRVQNHELLEKFIFQYALGEGDLDASVTVALSLP